MTKPRQSYSTDLNDIEYFLIEQELPAMNVTGRPCQYCWREILNGIFYMDKNGCTWRNLPHDLPPWRTVYYYMRKLQKMGLWEKLNRIIREQVRQEAGKEPQASLMVMDAQTAKSAEGGEEIGYDGGKNVNGRKRTLVVDSLGLLILVLVTAANVQDVHAGKQILEELSRKTELTSRLKKIIADGGYRGKLVDWVNRTMKCDLEIVLKLGDHKGFQVLPKRWVVERTNAWITRQRRLARDYERLVAVCEAFIYIAMLRISLRRLARARAPIQVA